MPFLYLLDPNKQINKQTNKRTPKQTNKQNTHPNKQANKQTNKQKQTNQTDINKDIKDVYKIMFLFRVTNIVRDLRNDCTEFTPYSSYN